MPVLEDCCCQRIPAGVPLCGRSGSASSRRVPACAVQSRRAVPQYPVILTFLAAPSLSSTSFLSLYVICSTAVSPYFTEYILQAQVLPKSIRGNTPQDR